MSMRRPMALLCALCFILSSPFSAAYAVDAKSIDELGIDPWGDLQQMQQGQISTVQDLDESELEEDPVYVLSNDVGIMPLLDTADLTWRIRLEGFSGYGTDADGDEWTGPSVLNTVTYGPVVTGVPQNGWDTPVAGWSGWELTASAQRPSPLNSWVAQSENPNWVGRQAIMSGDPMITLRSSYNWSSGKVFFDVTNFQEEKGVSSLQIIDGAWRFGLGYGYWKNPSPSSVLMTELFKSGYISSPVVDAHLYINGKDVGAIPSSYIEKDVSSNGIVWVTLRVSDLVITFEEQMVRSLSVVFGFGPVAWKNSLRDCNGGIGVQIYGERGGSRPMVSDSTRFVSGVDPAIENTGLLRGIIEFLQSIVNGIGNIASAIAALPGKIVNLIIEGLKSLFVPSEEDFANLKDQYQDLLAERLGFIWQAGEWITSFGSELLSALSGGAEAEFKFPGVGFDMAGAHYQLIEEQAVDFGSNGIVVVIRPFIGTIVSIVVVGACVNLFHDMVTALISGKSYFDFLKGDGST